jgi:hypothetical protein
MESFCSRSLPVRIKFETKFGPIGFQENKQDWEWLHPGLSGEPLTRRLIPTPRDSAIEQVLAYPSSGFHPFALSLGLIADEREGCSSLQTNFQGPFLRVNFPCV